MKKWIFFDVGGVLLNRDAPERERIELIHEAVARYRPEVTLNDVRAVVPAASEEIGGLTLNIISQLLSNQEEREAVFLEVKRRFEENQHDKMSFVDFDARRVTKELSQKFRLGLMANQPKKVKERLMTEGVLEHFTHQGVSGEYGFHKPDPRLFETVFRETEADPFHSIMIDDNIERGLVPAKGFGMKTVWRKRMERKTIPSEAIDHVITSLKDLPELFLRN